MVGNMNASVIVGIMLIWSLIGLALLIWYLWAMSRLFPKLGLRSWEGWIPVWNQWRLIERAGLPGWVVLLGFVGLGVVPLVFLIIAMHRVNSEAGVGAGYTVLGVFIPPLWATLLVGVIGERVLPGAPAAYTTPYPQPAPAPQGAPEPAPFTAPAPQPQWLPPVPPAGQGAPFHSAPPAGQSPLGPETDAEYARLAAESFQAPPAAPLGRQEVPEPFSWTDASREQPPAPPAPEPPPLHPVAPPAPPAAPGQSTPEPPAPRTPPAPPAPPVPPAPPMPPASSAVFPEISTDSAFSTGSTDSPWAPRSATGSGSAPVPAQGKATGITGAFAPLPAVDAPVHHGRSGGVPGSAPAGGAEDDPLDDRTVVVPRKRAPRWQLVLPGGEAYDLQSDVIVGRRPTTPDGAALLAVHDATRTLSKSHVRMRFDGERWTVEDLGSTNGLVLLHEGGPEEEIEPHREVEATERMLFGTLEVRLHLAEDAA